MTTNHGYNTPEKGATDWHIPLNENFELIDTDVEIRDQGSNRTTYPPSQGAKFLATDTGRRYVGDGTDWIELPYPTSGGGEGGVATVPTGHTLADIEAAIAVSNFVRLEPGVNYTGGSTITVDPRDRDVHIDARGAEITYTGSGVCVDITENFTSNYRGRVFWEGGEFHGPGQGTGTAFRITDSFGHDLSPDAIGIGFSDNGWGNAFYLRCMDNWAEGNAIHDVLQIENCDHWVLFRGADDLGGTGTGSFRFTRVQNIMGGIDGSPAIEASQHSDPYNSVFANLTGFMNVSNGRLLRLDGGWGGSQIYNLFVEIADASSGYVLEVGDVSTLPFIWNIVSDGRLDGEITGNFSDAFTSLSAAGVVRLNTFPIMGVDFIEFEDGTRISGADF